ncbi:hypothetical protein MPLB_300004 [Mesorhizobium sp. ORS 3324]|nr:hypothetical protein MPLB_300004 [Mesorhizobium sp. ORS 3324]
MGEPVDQETDDTAVSATAPGRKRDRSQIEFPYSDLERSIEMAAVLLREGGQAKIDLTQLAVAMDQSATGGTFRGRLGAARMFGLLETDAGKVGLTQLGLQATDEHSAAAAKAEAFLKIPLYKAMFDRYQGYALPPAAAIERQMESLGVPPKQKERARQAFSASAQYAGYIAANGRFSKPTFAGVRAKEESPAEHVDTGGGGGGGGSSGGSGGAGGSESSGQQRAEQGKALEYQLIDLMTEPDIDDNVKQSIWALVQYLTARKMKKATASKDTAAS